jgi:hypothetical protein
MSKFGNSTDSDHRIESQYTGETRGQLEPKQLLVGSVILAVISGPLIKVWTQLQTSLSSTSQFSGAWAAIVASLFVLAIIAKVLGLD